MKKRPILLFAAAVAALLWAADAVVAASTSGAVTAALTAALRDAGVKASFQTARLHPVFLRLDADTVEISDPAKPASRALYASRLSVRPDVLSWLRGRRDLSSVTIEGAVIHVVKDPLTGTFNVERVVQPGDPASGWKHGDWFKNLYERLKRAARNPVEAAERETPSLRVGRLKLSGRAVLTDRKMKPLVFRDVEIEARSLRWFPAGSVRFDALTARGAFRGARLGRFEAAVGRRRGGLKAAVSLKNLDLAPLLPLYRSTSPVFFEKGLLSLQSETDLTPERLESRHHLRIDDFEMKPAVAWSPETNVVIMALNRRKSLDIRFTLSGDPEKPSFGGFVESLLRALEKDFDKRTIELIRARARHELEKITF